MEKNKNQLLTGSMQALGSLPKSYAPPSITIIEINV